MKMIFGGRVFCTGQSQYSDGKAETYHLWASFHIQQVQQGVRMVLDAGVGHCLRVRDVGVVSIDEDTGLWDILGEEVPRPEGAILVPPCLEGMIGTAAGVQAVNEDEAR